MINKYKYTEYTCDICRKNITKEFSSGGTFPIFIKARCFQISGFKKWFHADYIICQDCQKEIAERINP